MYFSISKFLIAYSKYNASPQYPHVSSSAIHYEIHWVPLIALIKNQNIIGHDILYCIRSIFYSQQPFIRSLSGLVSFLYTSNKSNRSNNIFPSWTYLSLKALFRPHRHGIDLFLELLKQWPWTDCRFMLLVVVPSNVNLASGLFALWQPWQVTVENIKCLQRK